MSDEHDEKTISGTIVHSRVGGHVSVVLERDASDSLADGDLKRDIARSLRTAFQRPPSDEHFAGVMAKAPKGEDWVDELFCVFTSCQWRAHRKQIDELKDACPVDEGIASIKLNFLIGMLEERIRELSLALDFVERAFSPECARANPTLYAGVAEVRSRILRKLEHPDVVNAFRVACTAARSANVSEAAVLDNWAEYYWERGQFEEALRIFQEASNLFQKTASPSEKTCDLLGLAERQIIVDRARAVATACTAYQMLDRSGFDAPTSGEAKRTIATVMYRAARDLSGALKIAKEAYDALSTHAGYEAKAASAAVLVTSIARRVGEEDTADQYAREEERWLRDIRSDHTLFRVALRKAHEAGTLAGLASLESAAIRAGSKTLYGDWAGAYCLALHGEGRSDEALAHIDYAISQIPANGGSHETLAVLHRGRALCLSAVDRPFEALDALVAALEFDPGDHQLKWQLCNNSCVLGRYEIALRASMDLIRVAPNWAGPYRIAARAYVAQGELEQARVILDSACEKFAEHEELRLECAEALQLELGLLEQADAKYLRVAIENEKTTIEETCAPVDGLPEFHHISAFAREVIEKIAAHTLGLQSHPPPFVLQTFPPKEEHYRDDCVRQLSLQWRSTGAEVKRGAGRSDLVVIGSQPSEGDLIAEYKIWGRNDYLKAPDQCVGYMTDRESIGVVVMISDKKLPIAEKYIEQVILTSPSYDHASFRRSPIFSAMPRLEHFYSRHRDSAGRAVGIFHFLFHITKAKSG